MARRQNPLSDSVTPLLLTAAGAAGAWWWFTQKDKPATPSPESKTSSSTGALRITIDRVEWSVADDSADPISVTVAQDGGQENVFAGARSGSQSVDWMAKQPGSTFLWKLKSGDKVILQQTFTVPATSASQAPVKWKEEAPPVLRTLPFSIPVAPPAQQTPAPPAQQTPWDLDPTVLAIAPTVTKDDVVRWYVSSGVYDTGFLARWDEPGVSQVYQMMLARAIVFGGYKR